MAIAVVTVPRAIKASASHGRRTAARVAAVQALYEMEVADAEPEAVIADVLSERNGRGDSDASETPVPEIAHLRTIVQGVAIGRDELDRQIAAALAEDLVAERLEIVLRAILRAGAFELATLVDIPLKVIINEYVDVAHAFFAGKEPTLVNAVLDRLARRLREPEACAPEPRGGG